MALKLEVGMTYQTKSAGPVEIVEDLGAGRKRFVGRLLADGIDEDKRRVTYFRTGAYSNSMKGGHPYDIVKP